MISSILALPSVRVLPKIMGPWTEQSIPHGQPAWSTSAPWLPHEWTLISIYTKEVLRVFFFLFIFFLLIFFFTVKQLHHTEGSHEVWSQIKLPDVFHKLNPVSHFREPPYTTRELRCAATPGKAIYYTLITKPLSMPDPMTKVSSKISISLGKS